MKVFITGGAGFVGTTLTHGLLEQGHKVTLLTRSAGDKLSMGADIIEGDPAKKGPWQEYIGGHDVIINLAGASIFKRWTKKYKKSILESRVLTTENLVEALAGRKGKKTSLLSASAVGYYGFHKDEELDEGSPCGSDFLASVTRKWESAALEAQKHGVRVVLCRLGIVLGAKGGAIARSLPLFKMYLGSPLGDGRQWFSWVHEQDLARIFLFLINSDGVSGPVNCTAPHPVINSEMTGSLAKALNRSTFMPPVPGLMIRLIMGEFGSVLVKGQKVLPKELLGCGFQFKFSKFGDAIEDILTRTGGEK
ncbi:MAG: TIGR01777 family protein [Desulfobacterales bacterium]|nr:TIGR01777 family protein [Desulfobacterales bacterium]